MLLSAILTHLFFVTLRSVATRESKKQMLRMTLQATEEICLFFLAADIVGHHSARKIDARQSPHDAFVADRLLEQFNE